ncbi:hypothetical protein N9N28_07145 [Rubripirellula amarantea]|nr:hypothetical protein [Rubripirellula amarantea]
MFERIRGWDQERQGLRRLSSMESKELPNVHRAARNSNAIKRSDEDQVATVKLHGSKPREQPSKATLRLAILEVQANQMSQD